MGSRPGVSRSTRRRWWSLGFLTELVALLRWQTAVCGVLFLLCVVDAARRKRLSWRWVAEAAVLGAVTVVPQLAARKVIYGTCNGRRCLVVRPFTARVYSRKPVTSVE